MSGDEELQDLFRRLARAVPRQPSGAGERELLAKFRSRHKRAKRPSAYAAEAAALLVVVAALYFASTHGRSIQQRGARAAAVNESSGFIMLPYAESGVPMEQPVIVRVKISFSELGAMGMPFAALRRGSVNADLLVGQDGVARAVRVAE